LSRSSSPSLPEPLPALYAPVSMCRGYVAYPKRIGVGGKSEAARTAPAPRVRAFIGSKDTVQLEVPKGI